MPELTRRKFLIASIGTAGLLSGAAAIGWPELQKAAHDRPLADGTGILVLVTMYGGNDGLNTLIPHADNVYHDKRPSWPTPRRRSCTSTTSWGSTRP